MLYEGLYRAGLSNMRSNGERDENLFLKGVLITNAVYCVPPENKPTPEEFRTCRFRLEETLCNESITDILCIGREAYLAVCKVMGLQKGPAFGHGKSENMGRFKVHMSYHTSGYNQSTGRIRQEDVDTLLLRIISKE